MTEIAQFVDVINRSTSVALGVAVILLLVGFAAGMFLLRR